jgi:hypothetical protein
LNLRGAQRLEVTKERGINATNVASFYRDFFLNYKLHNYDSSHIWNLMSQEHKLEKVAREGPCKIKAHMKCTFLFLKNKVVVCDCSHQRYRNKYFQFLHFYGEENVQELHLPLWIWSHNGHVVQGLDDQPTILKLDWCSFCQISEHMHGWHFSF